MLAQNDDGGRGTNSRIVHQAAVDGNYRLIATSLSGTRLGACTVAVRVLSETGAAVAPLLPAWFHALDTDHDGQIALHEWREGGKNLADFRKYDRDDDGFLTPEEVHRYVRLHPEVTQTPGGPKR